VFAIGGRREYFYELIEGESHETDEAISLLTA
jgi:hypothetical protein